MGACTVLPGVQPSKAIGKRVARHLTADGDGNDLAVEDDGGGFEAREGGFERGGQVVAGATGEEDGAAIDLQGADEFHGNEVGDGAGNGRGALSEQGTVAVAILEDDGADRSGIGHSGLILGGGGQHVLIAIQPASLLEDLFRIRAGTPLRAAGCREPACPAP